MNTTESASPDHLGSTLNVSALDRMRRVPEPSRELMAMIWVGGTPSPPVESTREKMISEPSGDQLGVASNPGTGDSRCSPVPSASITKMPLPSTSLTKAILVPSGLHEPYVSLAPLVVRRDTPLPSVFIRYRW